MTTCLGSSQAPLENPNEEAGAPLFKFCWDFGVHASDHGQLLNLLRRPRRTAKGCVFLGRCFAGALGRKPTHEGPRSEACAYLQFILCFALRYGCAGSIKEPKYVWQDPANQARVVRLVASSLGQLNSGASTSFEDGRPREAKAAC